MAACSAILIRARPSCACLAATQTIPSCCRCFRAHAGTTFTYFFGYLIVAVNPLRHTGIAIVGGIGKVGFAIQMLKFYTAGLANAHALIVVVGDLIFCALFLCFFYRLLKTGNRLL